VLLIPYGPVDPIALLSVVVLSDFGQKLQCRHTTFYNTLSRQITSRQVFSIIWYAMQENKQGIKKIKIEKGVQEL